MNLDTTSRIAQVCYTIVLVMNLVIGIWLGDFNRLLLALIFGALIINQRALDSWRGAATAWRETAESWRDLAQRRL